MGIKEKINDLQLKKSPNQYPRKCTENHMEKKIPKLGCKERTNLDSPYFQSWFRSYSRKGPLSIFCDWHFTVLTVKFLYIKNKMNYKYLIQ